MLKTEMRNPDSMHIDKMYKIPHILAFIKPEMSKNVVFFKKNLVQCKYI